MTFASPDHDDITKLLNISPDYSIHEAPVNRFDPGKPVPVEFSINLRNVLGVNEKEQLISLETSLRMFWKDPRISLKVTYPSVVH